MTITLYSGVPGSGKSMAAARLLRYRLNGPYPRPCIANFPIGSQAKVKHPDYFHYWPNDRLTPDRLVHFAHVWWDAAPELFREDYITVFIDECQLLYNSRRWAKDKNRMDWLEFFSQHRKFGYHVVLIAQSAKMIDNQFRMLIDDEVNCRKLSRCGIAGWILSLPFRQRAVFQVRYLYQTRERLGSELCVISKRDMCMVDSYGTFAQVPG